MASVPQTTEFRLLQHVRDWVLASLGIDGSKVLIAQKGQFYTAQGAPTGDALFTSRPELPYLIISMVTSDIKIGFEDRWVTNGDELKIRGPRTATVDIQGHGLPAYDWLAHLGLRTPEIKGVSITAFPGITDLSGLSEEDYIEARYSKEFELVYSLENANTIPISTVGTIEVDPDFGDIIVEDI